MTRQIHLTLNADEEGQIHLIRELLESHGVTPTELTGKRDGREIIYFQFVLQVKVSGRLLDQLAEHGIGTSKHAGCTIEVLELRSATPGGGGNGGGGGGNHGGGGGIGGGAARYRVTDRASVDEIYQRVDATYHLTFDFLLTAAIAAIVCGIGLVAKEAIYVTASMLLSPLMGPIQASAVGAMVRDRNMLMKGLRNEAIALVLCLVVGIIVGGICLVFGGDLSAPVTDRDFESLHYRPSDLVLGACIALPSGAALALAVSTALSETIVGVAIATSIIPPVVAAGINLCFALHLLTTPDALPGNGTDPPSSSSSSSSFWDEDDPTTDEVAASKLVDAALGVAMLAINWLLIMLGCALILRLKAVGPGLLQDWSLTQGNALPRARALDLVLAGGGGGGGGGAGGTPPLSPSNTTQPRMRTGSRAAAPAAQHHPHELPLLDGDEDEDEDKEEQLQQGRGRGESGQQSYSAPQMKTVDVP